MPTATSARWIVQPRDPQAEERLRRELGVTSIVAALLVQRGYTEPEAAHKFLNPRLEDLHSPTSLPDYAAARDAILGAKERKEKIFVHGDYDVDGVTSAALLNRFLSRIGCDVYTHVPHRMKEGYGINISAVAAAKEHGARLFLTCDCGVSAHEQVEMAKEAGMRVVVTDHHTIGATLPGADAVVNPHREDSTYPFAELSGAGVVFKLCMGLSDELNFPRDKYCRAFLDLAALGTIADVMPLEDENRIIARFGLAQLAETQKPGLRALYQEAKIQTEPGKPLRAFHVGFVLGPRLNAAGRLDDAALALKLLIESDETQAADYARRIEEVNTARRVEQQRLVEEAVEMVVSNGWQERHVIVVGGPNWHAGIVGIVAGRLVDQFHRPCFVVTMNTETGFCKGSARTIPNFHLADAIRAHPDIMTGGGHAMAAGCSFRIEDFERVADALDLYARERLTPEDLIPAVTADLEIDPAEITIPALQGLAQMEPFGCANPEPMFVARNVSFAQILPTKSPTHVRLTLRPEMGTPVQGIAFNIGERVSDAGVGTRADLLFQPQLDEWRGNLQLKWSVKDFRPLEA